MTALVIVPVLGLAACATLAGHEHANMLKLAQQDDRICASRGWHYPAPRYVTCRMQLDDRRQYRDWMNLQMLKQTQFQHPGAPPTYPAQEAYRPLDRDHYQCQYLTENDQDYILCGETGSGT